jgi:glycosyltransferase involved in cell wall biosynthesis
LKEETSYLVSIALCTYNGADNLEAQLDTLVNQTYEIKEIIIVDDCSSDSTLQIIERYQRNFPFVKVFKNEFNLGYIKNFERAISFCSGEYIALADQDDIWHLDKIKLMVDNIGQHALIYHDSQFVDERGNLLPKKLSEVLKMYEGNQPHFFIFNNCISGHSLLFNRRLLKDVIPFDKRYFHDKYISLIASERGGIKYLDYPLVRYRQHAGSITDILDLKTKKRPERLFNKAIYHWLGICRDKSLQHKEYFNSIMLCFDEDLRIVKRLRLFYLLSIKADLIFYNYKKSFLSRLNFIRKICFLRKHNQPIID